MSELMLMIGIELEFDTRPFPDPDKNSQIEDEWEINLFSTEDDLLDFIPSRPKIVRNFYIHAMVRISDLAYESKLREVQDSNPGLSHYCQWVDAFTGEFRNRDKHRGWLTAVPSLEILAILKEDEATVNATGAYGAISLLEATKGDLEYSSVLLFWQ